MSAHPYLIVYFKLQDQDAPYEASLLYMERLATENVDIVLRKTGDHRLNTSVDHILLLSELDRLLKQYPVTSSQVKSKL
jgi:hypothetical protein